MKYLLFLLLFTSTSLAQDFKGIAAYSILNSKFPCKDYQLQIHRVRRPAIAVLYGTFGTNFSCLSKTLHLLRNKSVFLEIHFSNESARRMRRMFEGEFLRGISVSSYNSLLAARNVELSVKVHKLSVKILKLLTPFTRPTLEISISSGLEDNFTPSAFSALASLLRTDFPFPLIRSSVTPGKGGDYQEYHQATISPAKNIPTTIINPDGESLSKAQYKALLKQCSHCKVVFFWSKGLQGRLGIFQSPRTRTFMLTLEDRQILTLFR